MKKLLLNGFLLTTVLILVIGCSNPGNKASKVDNKNVVSETSKVDKDKSMNNDITSSKDEPSQKVDDKVWEDVSTFEEGEKYDFPQSAGGFIHMFNKEMNTIPSKDSKLIQAGYDKYYYYKNTAEPTLGILNKIIKVKGKSLEKDVNNLIALISIISNEYAFKKKVQNDIEKQAVIYTQELLNDLDIAMNKGGKRDTFGLTHQLDGKKVGDLEMFINNTLFSFESK